MSTTAIALLFFGSFLVLVLLTKVVRSKLDDIEAAVLSQRQLFMPPTNPPSFIPPAVVSNTIHILYDERDKLKDENGHLKLKIQNYQSTGRLIITSIEEARDMISALVSIMAFNGIQGETIATKERVKSMLGRADRVAEHLHTISLDIRGKL